MLIKDSHVGDNFYDFINSPDALFHFTKKSVALEKILPTSTLKFGSFNNTNDPLEYKPLSPVICGHNWSQYTRNKTWDIDDEVQRKSRENSGFISFCQNSFENGLITECAAVKSRMWSQYGDSHEGVCLVLSKSEIIKSLQDLPKSYDISYSDITYFNTMRSEDFTININGDTFDNKSAEDVVDEFILENKNSLFFKKQKDYRDEKEFRALVISSNKDDQELILDIDKALQGVVLGDKFPSVYTSTVNFLLRHRKAQLRKLNWHHDGFILEQCIIESES